jgi:predicted SprT family Zn-dependent metalloprotease
MLKLENTILLRSKYMEKKDFEEFEVECGKCHKNFKVKLKDPTTIKKYTFICGKCSMEMIKKGEF